MFLSEWREFPSAPCLAGKETWWQLASRFCWNRARPWHASELVSFLVGLRTYQHPVPVSPFVLQVTGQFSSQHRSKRLLLSAFSFRRKPEWLSSTTPPPPCLMFLQNRQNEMQVSRTTCPHIPCFILERLYEAISAVACCPPLFPFLPAFPSL